MKKILIKAFLFTVFSFLIFSCSDSKEKRIVTIKGETMGTFYSVKIATEEEEFDEEKVKGQIDSLLKNINYEMSTYIPESEISEFNEAYDTSWFLISKDFYEVTKKALEISRETDGYYDVTVGPLVNLWGFGPSTRDKLVPDNDEINYVKQFVNYRLLELQENPYAIKKKDPRVYVDLSSIAKGFGVDEVSRLLASLGYKNHLVEIGGELRSLGTKFEEPWIVGIENPTKDNIAIKVVLENKSIATSGDYYNYFEYKGKRYSHTINPKTGWPIENKLASVSVIEDDCMTADAYATAIEAMGPDLGLKFAREKKLPVYLIVRDKEKFETKSTKEFEKFIKK